MRLVYPVEFEFGRLVFLWRENRRAWNKTMTNKKLNLCIAPGRNLNLAGLLGERQAFLTLSRSTEICQLPELYYNNTALADFLCVCFFFMFVLDPTYGDLTDYVYDKLNVTHSYGLELRPGADEPNGFLLPDCEIVPTGREIMAALKAITPILEGKKAGAKFDKDENQNKSRRGKKRRS